MTINADIAIAGAVAPYSEELDPEEFRALIYGHPASERLRWWRALEDPSFDEVRRLPEGGGRDMWMRREMDISPYRALVQGVSARQVWSSQGRLEMGDVRITTMPDEIPLGHGDHVVCLGRRDTDGVPDARTLIARERIVRGEVRIEREGTVSSSGATLSGQGTSFGDLRAGDIVVALGEALRVISVEGETALTLERAPARTWSGVSWAQAVDRLRYAPARGIDLIVGSDRDYTPEVDFTLSGDDGIRWLSAGGSPAPGSAYSVLYSYYPRFIVREDLGYRRIRRGGVSLPLMVVARLLRPDLSA